MNGKMVAIFGVLIIGLAVAGASYAMWTETLSVSGTVAAGELDAGFLECECSDSDGDGVYEGEGHVLCELTDTDGDGDNETAVITIVNGYPCYTATCDLTIMNTGTIPLHVAGVNIVNADPELDVSISDDPTCTILDVGETATFDVEVHVNDNAAELGDYGFSVTVDIEQFNYAPQ